MANRIIPHDLISHASERTVVTSKTRSRRGKTDKAATRSIASVQKHRSPPSFPCPVCHAPHSICHGDIEKLPKAEPSLGGDTALSKSSTNGRDRSQAANATSTADTDKHHTDRSTTHRSKTGLRLPVDEQETEFASTNSLAPSAHRSRKQNIPQNTLAQIHNQILVQSQPQLSAQSHIHTQIQSLAISHPQHQSHAHRTKHMSSPASHEILPTQRSSSSGQKTALVPSLHRAKSTTDDRESDQTRSTTPKPVDSDKQLDHIPHKKESGRSHDSKGSKLHSRSPHLSATNIQHLLPTTSVPSKEKASAVMCSMSPSKKEAVQASEKALAMPSKFMVFSQEHTNVDAKSHIKEEHHEPVMSNQQQASTTQKRPRGSHENDFENPSNIGSSVDPHGDKTNTSKKQRTKKSTCFYGNCRNEPTKFCLFGCGYICMTCLPLHASANKEEHHIIDIQAKSEREKRERQAPGADEICDRHPGHLVNKFCVECVDPMPYCPLCFEEKHPKHHSRDAFSDIPMIVAEIEKTKPMAELLVQDLKRNQIDARKRMQNAVESADQLCTQIEAHANQLVELIKKYQSALVDEVRQVQKSVVDKLQNYCDIAQSSRTQIAYGNHVATKTSHMRDGSFKASNLRQVRCGFNAVVERSNASCPIAWPKLSIHLNPIVSLSALSQSDIVGNPLGKLDIDRQEQAGLLDLLKLNDVVESRGQATEGLIMHHFVGPEPTQSPRLVPAVPVQTSIDLPKPLLRQSSPQLMQLDPSIAQLNSPRSVAFSPYNQRLYVVDTCNHRVVVLSDDLVPMHFFGSHGSGPGQFNSPVGIRIWQDGTVVVSDLWNYRIQIFDPHGNFIKAVGEQGTGPGQLQLVFGLDIDSEGRIYVCDYGNNRIQVFSIQGTLLHIIMGSSAPIPAYPVDGIPLHDLGPEPLLRSPTGIVAVEEGFWCVYKNGQWLGKFQMDGTYILGCAITSSSDWVHLSRGPYNTMIVTDENNAHVFIFNPLGGLIAQIPCENFYGRRLNGVAGCATHSLGSLVLCDAVSSRIEIVDIPFTAGP